MVWTLTHFCWTEFIYVVCHSWDSCVVPLAALSQRQLDPLWFIPEDVSLLQFNYSPTILVQLFLAFFHVSAQSVISSPLSLQSSPRLRPWHALRWFRTDPEICSGHKTINIHLWIHVCNSKMIFPHWWIGYYNQLILGGCQDALQNV